MVVSQAIIVHKAHSQRIGIYRLVKILKPTNNELNYLFFNKKKKKIRIQIISQFQKIKSFKKEIDLNKKTINLQLFDRDYPCNIQINNNSQNHQHFHGQF